MKRFILLVLLPFAILGCSGSNAKDTTPTFGNRKLAVTQTHQGARPIKVVCTIGMVADVVRNVGGKLVEVDQLLRDGVDPHGHTLNTDEVARMSSADVIFYSGLHLEGKMTDALERLALKKPTFPVTEYLDSKSILLDEDNHPDPHVWFDVSLWREVADVIGNALSLYDPTNATSYKKNSENYRAELSQLHEEAKTKIAAVQPNSKRVMITSHDAFQYFGRAYDIEVKGIQGISTEDEAGLGHINRLVDFIVARKVPAVFVETSVSPRNMKSLLEGCKARKHNVVLGGELFSDAMGESGTPEGTYIGMIRHNVETITKALR